MSRNYQVTQSKASVVPCCNFCKNANKPFDHWLKNRDGSISCTVLKQIECQFCFEVGHTMSQCKTRDAASASSISRPMKVRPPAQPKPAATSFASKNIFNILDEDEEKEEDKCKSSSGKKIKQQTNE